MEFVCTASVCPVLSTTFPLPESGRALLYFETVHPLALETLQVDPIFCATSASYRGSCPGVTVQGRKSQPSRRAEQMEAWAGR